MGAVVVLLLMFGIASLPLTYLLSFAFNDEMKALQAWPPNHPHLQPCVSGVVHKCTGPLAEAEEYH